MPDPLPELEIYLYSLVCFQSDKSFYVFTAFGGGNQYNTMYDANCTVDRAFGYWTCDPDDLTLTSCHEYMCADCPEGQRDSCSCQEAIKKCGGHGCPGCR